MKHITTIIFVSLAIGSYYEVGDTISVEHQNIPLNICHGENEGTPIYLSDNIGKITVLGIDATW